MISDMSFVFIVLLLTTIAFLIPRFRADLVSVCALLTLTLTGMLTVNEALAGFANNVVIMIAALFIVGEGVFQTGLAQRAGQLLAKITRNSELRLMIFMMILVAVLSGFMSNTGTVAVLLPVVVSLCVQMKVHPGKYLMPLAFASSMGGVLTLIGTAPNLIASETLRDYGFGALSFFSFTPIGIVLLAVGMVYLLTIGRKQLQKHGDAQEDGSQAFDGKALIEAYGLKPQLHLVQVPHGHQAVGKTLQQLKWPVVYGLSVLEIIRGVENTRFRFTISPTQRRITCGPSDVIQGHDVLLMYGEPGKFYGFVEATSLHVVTEAGGSKKLSQPETSKLAEVLLTPQSRLLNQTLASVQFRDKYGLTVLAVKRAQQKAHTPESGEKLQYGDALLVYGKWKNIDSLSAEKSDTVVLRFDAKPTTEQGSPGRALLAGVILLGMISMLALDIVPGVVAVAVAAMAMVLTGCIRHTDQAYRSISWQTVVLIAAMLPMATALEKTGGVAFMSDQLLAGLGDLGPIAIMAGLYAVTSVFSQFISNTATAVLLFPVAIMTAVELSVSPIPLVIAVAVAASMAFATPVATPPNAMVMSAGKYTFLDFMRVGAPLQILIAVVAMLIIPLVFPF